MKHRPFVFKGIFKNCVNTILKTVKGGMTFYKLVGLIGNYTFKQERDVLEIIIKCISAHPAGVDNVFNAYFTQWLLIKQVDKSLFYFSLTILLYPHLKKPLYIFQYYYDSIL